MKKIVIYIFAIFLLFACDNERKVQETLLKATFVQAGNNSSELLTVLKHFQSDPLKFEAAKFLIANMYDKISLDSASVVGAQPFYDFLADYIHQKGKYEDTRIYYYLCDSIKNEIPDSTIHVSARYKLDNSFITAQYLIDHINKAFDIWQNNHWNTEIPFEDFCKYILPYKSSNDYWPESNSYFRSKYLDTINAYYNDSYTIAGKCIDDTIKKTFGQDGQFFISFPFMRPTTFQNYARAQLGTCIEANTTIVSAMRSFGIPAVLNFIPYWGNSNAGHHWTEIVGEPSKGIYNNEQLPSPKNQEDIVNDMFWFKFDCETLEGIPENVQIRTCRTVPKVYRCNYAIQTNGLASIASTRDIPNIFKNRGLEDITDSYVECYDINVPLEIESRPNEFAYLCCYDPDNISWTPVSWGIIHGKKAKFKKMGKNIVYLPAYYREGRIIPAGSPFLLTRDGKINLLNGNKGTHSKVTLYSKVPFRNHCLYYAYVMLGNRFLVANQQDLSDTVVVHTIDKIPYYGQNITIENAPPSRYGIFYFGTDNEYAFIAELEFWGLDENGHEILLKGTPFGNNGRYGNTAQEMIDGNRESFFYGALNDVGYVGLDFGKPYRITRIKYNPRSDDNNIVPDELYELYYWTTNGWESLGQQKGNEDQTLKYTNIPKNTLLRIHNHTRGKENRIFLYDDDKQIFY